MPPKKLIKIDPPRGFKLDLIKLGHDPINPRRSVKTVNPEAKAILSKKRPETAPKKSTKRKGKWIFGLGAFLGSLGLFVGKSWGMDFPEPPEIAESIDASEPILVQQHFWEALPIWLADHSSPLATIAIVGIGVVIGLAILHRLIRIEKTLAPRITAIQSTDENAEIKWKPRWAAIGGASRTGLVRQENQDAFCTFNIPNQDISIIAVFDGMGGRTKGKEAAEISASFVQNWLTSADPQHWGTPDKSLRYALEACQADFKDKHLVGASTALLVAITPDRVHYVALGDGAIALIHSDGMVQQLLAPHHKPGAPKNLITAFMSADKTFTPRVGTVACEPDSIVTVMSDGASDLVNFERLGAQHDAIFKTIDDISADSFAKSFLTDIERLTLPDSDRPLHTDNMTLALGIVRGQS